MALTCARCGAQNPEGNLYCQSCGNPLAAVPAAAAPPPYPPGAPPEPQAFVGPPPGIAPPVAGPTGYQAPTGYQSPYYAPSAPVAPVHRTPWMLIIAAVVALTVLMAGCGTALAILGNRGTANNSGPGVGTELPSPTPGVTPTPIASPTSAPLGATTESNDGVSVKVPAQWSVANKDVESITLSDPNSEGTVTVASGPSSPPQTAQDNKNTVDTELKTRYPDARNCPNTTTITTSFNGATGISWTMCFTLTQGGHSLPAAASLFAGANSTGSVYYAVLVLTRQDNLSAFLVKAKPVLQSVQWKLT